MPNQLFRNFRRPQSASSPLGPFSQGVNEKTEPHLLEFSELSDARNIVIDETNGRLRKRPGTLFKSTVPFLTGAPKRAYTFVRRDGTEIMLITDDKVLVASSDLITFTNITPAAFLVGGQFVGGSASLEFETAEDRVLITNGVDPVFSWAGSGACVAYDRGTAEITLNAGDTSSSITDALLDRAADGTTWVGQMIVVTDSTVPSRIGQISRITGFVDATNTITFDPIPGLAVGDKVKVGVAIPRGRVIRYHFGTLFVGATVDNLSEIRFTDTVDPNEPSLTLSFESPHAWPPELQLELGLGDRIWGFSPVYRDRFVAFKASGIFRIDPDPSFRFLPSVITAQIGSRFPGSWRQHNSILMFLGQDQDGLPDVYMTDFTDVTHFNRKHSKTLDNLKQPSSIFRLFSLSSKSDFDAGSLSSLTETANGAIQCRKVDTQTEVESVLESGANVDLESEPGRVGLLGSPVGGSKYDASVLPSAAAVPWNYDGSFNTVESLGAGVVNLSFAGGPGAGTAERRQRGVLNATQDAMLFVRGAGPNRDLDGMSFGLWNGSKCVIVEAVVRTFFSSFMRINGVNVGACSDNRALNNYNLLLKADGTWKLWRNGTLFASGAAVASSINKVQFAAGVTAYGGLGFGNPIVTDAQCFFIQGGSAVFDTVNFNGNYKGDSLSSYGGKIAPTSLPAVLPTSGEIVLNIDAKKAIETNPGSYRYGKFSFETENNGGSISFQTSATNRAGASLAGFVALSSGQEPGLDNTTPKGQHLLVKATIGSLVPGVGDELVSFTGGFLYLTPPINIGAEIKKWEAFQRTLLQAFPLLTLKIRRATAASLAAAFVATPDSVDNTGWLIDQVGAVGNITNADGFVNISDAQNIGTVFGGVEGLPNPPFPEARHVQILVSGHVDTVPDALLAGVDLLLVNFTEGSPEILPVASVLLKKKWLLIAATLDSTFNNLIVTVDGNRSFVNWEGVNSNFLTWFRGKLYAGSSTSADLLQVEDLLRDDDGDDGAGGRKIKAIEAYIVTKQEIGGEINERKKAQALDVMADNDVTSAIVVKSQRDEQAAPVVLGQPISFGATETHKRLRFPAGLQFKRIQILAENKTIDQDFPLEGFVFSYDRVPGRSGI